MPIFTGKFKRALIRIVCWLGCNRFSQEQIQTKLLAGIVASSLCVAMLLSLDLIDDVLIHDKQNLWEAMLVRSVYIYISNTSGSTQIHVALNLLHRKVGASITTSFYASPESGYEPEYLTVV